MIQCWEQFFIPMTRILQDYSNCNDNKLKPKQQSNSTLKFCCTHHVCNHIINIITHYKISLCLSLFLLILLILSLVTTLIPCLCYLFSFSLYFFIDPQNFKSTNTDISVCQKRMDMLTTGQLRKTEIIQSN